MEKQLDNLIVCDAWMQIQYYIILPKHVKGSVSELGAFKFNLADDGFIWSVDK